MSFISAVTSTDEEAVDTLFGKKTPGADDLLGGAKPKGEEDANDEGDDTGDDGQQQPPVAKTKTKAKAKGKEGVTAKVDFEAADTSHLTDEEVVNDLFPGEELDEKGNPIVTDPKAGAKPAVKVTDPKATDPKAAAAKALPTDTEIDYEAIYEKMVEDGVWDEVKLPDGAEWNADTFKKVQQFQSTTQYQDLLDKTGPYGKAIIEYEKNGGPVGELLNIFREQRAVQEYDIKTPDGQEEFLRSYLQYQGNSDKSIERQIKALKDQGPEAVEEEATEKKTLWDDQYNKEIEERQKEQALAAQQLEAAARKFEKVISDTLIADTEATPKERREYRDYMLNYTQTYNGKQVSQFYMDMAEIQKDPSNYVELAKFVKGIKNGDYKKKVEDKAKKEANAKSFLKIKNNVTLQRSGGGAVELGGDEGANFVTLLKKQQQRQ